MVTPHVFEEIRPELLQDVLWGPIPTPNVITMTGWGGFFTPVSREARKMNSNPNLAMNFLDLTITVRKTDIAK